MYRSLRLRQSAAGFIPLMAVWRACALQISRNEKSESYPNPKKEIEEKMMDASVSQPAESVLSSTVQQQIASSGIRAAGYLIDLIPACILALFGMIPLLGPIIAGLLLLPYWLFRDITGGSLAKMLLGLAVVKKDGSPATIGARILRNLPLAVGPGLLIIPLLGYVLAPVVAFLLVCTEVVMLVTQGNRLGDRLAGTTVVRR
jgi:uncharacterized RDD family membrane protein YckC